MPPLKDEVHGLITPGKNPWFEHAKAQLWLAERGGKVVGRISAQVDELVQEHMGQGIGQWGMFEALDGEAAAALIATAEDWLRQQGMTRALGPISLSIWDEPGLEIEGFDEPPTAMMGHHQPEYQAWIEAAGYAQGQGPADLRGRHRPLGRSQDQPPDRDGRAQPAHPHPRWSTSRKFNEEARLILNLLNDAWSNNWGYVPLTEAEIAYAGKKLKPIIYNELVRVAEIDGEPVAFMMTHPRHQRADQGPERRAVPVQLRQAAVAAAQAAHAALARAADGRREEAAPVAAGEPARLHADRIHPPRLRREIRHRHIGEFGWILEDNKGMLSIAELPSARDQSPLPDLRKSALGPPRSSPIFAVTRRFLAMRPGQAAMRQHPLLTAKAMRAAMPCGTAKSTRSLEFSFDPFL